MARPHSLIAYDASGVVVATMDYLVRYDENGLAIGLVDFAAHEEAGGELTDVWRVSNAVGSKTWPEWLGTKAHRMTVELVGPPGRKHLAALVHPSGHRRVRADIEAAIEERIRNGNGDIRGIVGGPGRPLQLDEEGKTKPREKREGSALPLIPKRGR
jgi:hypothetical protein